MEHIDETVVERLLKRSLAEDGAGRPISERARTSQRSVDSYLKAGVRPRWMERLMEIDRGIRRERDDLAAAHRHMRAHGDPATFAERWRAFADGRDFERLNTLIRQHNEWYPIERDLPMDPRTGDYRPILGRSHRRRELDAAWVLEQFPPDAARGRFARGGDAG